MRRGRYRPSQENPIVSSRPDALYPWSVPSKRWYPPKKPETPAERREFFSLEVYTIFYCRKEGYHDQIRRSLPLYRRYVDLWRD